MTPLILMEELKKIIEHETENLILPVRVNKLEGKNKERKVNVHMMRLPDKEAETKEIPYVLLQFLKQEDLHTNGETPESSGMIRIIVAAYSENSEEGAMCILDLLTRIRISLLKRGVVGEQFLLRPPLEMIVYPDNTNPYFLGEMITNWSMPVTRSEVMIW